MRNKNLVYFLVILFALAVPSEARKATAKHRVNPKMMRTRVIKLPWIANFPAIPHVSLDLENQIIDRDQVSRIKNSKMLATLVQTGDLIPVRCPRLTITSGIPFLRPWALDFLCNFSTAFYSEFGANLPASSFVRTEDYQRRLRRWNLAAAAPGASPHIGGVATDVPTSHMSVQQHSWVEAYLKSLLIQGKIDALEETRSEHCIHIVVSKSYSPLLRIPAFLVSIPVVMPVLAARQQQ